MGMGMSIGTSTWVRGHEACAMCEKYLRLRNVGRIKFKRHGGGGEGRGRMWKPVFPFDLLVNH